MIKKLAVSIVAIGIVLGMGLTVYGAQAIDTVLAEGGNVVLEQDYTLSENVVLSKDTVLDLNGHTLTGSIWQDPFINGDGIEITIECQPEIYIAKGATVTIKSGTLDTVGITVEGTLDEAKELTVRNGLSAITVEPGGVVKAIDSCDIAVLYHGVENGGKVELVYNSQISTEKYSAVHNNERSGARIELIDHCRFIGYDKERGSALDANTNNSIGTVKNTVLVGYGWGGINTSGKIDSVEKCTIISLRKAETQYDFGCAVSAFGIWPDSTWSTDVLKFTDCTMIAEKCACAVNPFTVPENMDSPEESFVNTWVTTETFPEMKGCTFIPLKKVKDIESYMDWEMTEPVEEIIAVPEKPTDVVSITVGGKDIVFSEDMGAPFIDSNNRTQVPVRIVLEAFGCQVDWDSQRRAAVIEKDGTTVEVPIGQNSITVNGMPTATDTAALIKDGRTYLPIRPVLEAFGATVDWNGESQTVVIE